MRVNDNGFTDRVATPSTLTSGVGRTGQGRSMSESTSSKGDKLHLSVFAPPLNSGSGVDASNRAERVSQLASAVNDKTFKVDTATVTGALISEALRSGG